jgi:hypothetical protein
LRFITSNHVAVAKALGIGVGTVVRIKTEMAA